MTEIIPFDPKRGRQAKYRAQGRRGRWLRPDAYTTARWRRWRVSPIMVMLPLTAFTAVLLWPDQPANGTGTPDSESARFAICGGAARVNCVVDGDTFWYRGAKYRVADINTPEVSEPQCDREAALGAAAAERLHALLNQGAFSLETTGRDRDRYGRLLRVVTRGGESLGGVLVREGLAEEWRGYRGSWC